MKNCWRYSGPNRPEWGMLTGRIYKEAAAWAEPIPGVMRVRGGLADSRWWSDRSAQEQAQATVECYAVHLTEWSPQVGDTLVSSPDDAARVVSLAPGSRSGVEGFDCVLEFVGRGTDSFTLFMFEGSAWEPALGPIPPTLGRERSEGMRAAADWQALRDTPILSETLARNIQDLQEAVNVAETIDSVDRSVAESNFPEALSQMRSLRDGYLQSVDTFGSPGRYDFDPIITARQQTGSTSQQVQIIMDAYRQRQRAHAENAMRNARPLPHYLAQPFDSSGMTAASWDNSNAPGFMYWESPAYPEPGSSEQRLKSATAMGFRDPGIVLLSVRQRNDLMLRVAACYGWGIENSAKFDDLSLLVLMDLIKPLADKPEGDRWDDI